MGEEEKAFMVHILKMNAYKQNIRAQDMSVCVKMKGQEILMQANFIFV